MYLPAQSSAILMPHHHVEHDSLQFKGQQCDFKLDSIFTLNTVTGVKLDFQKQYR